MIPEPGAKETAHATIIEWKDSVAFSFGPPQRNKFCQLVWIRAGEVVALRCIDAEVVELPRFGFVVRSLLVFADGLPLACHQGPAAGHLEVLEGVGCRRLCITEDTGKRMTGDGQLSPSPEYVRRGDLEEVVDGGHDVSDVDELPAHRPPLVFSDAGWPGHDHRDVDPALVGVLLVPLERAVAALGPSPRIVGVAMWSTDLVDPFDGLVWCFEDPVEVLHLVHDAEGTTLLGGAVVGEDDEERVVQFSNSAETVDEATDLVVGVVEKGGKGFL